MQNNKQERLLLAPYHGVPREFSDRKIFFLAGPILGGGYWQGDAKDHLWGKNPGCIVADPSYHRSNTQRNIETLCGMRDKSRFIRQAEWESYAMKLAAEKGTLFFWLGEESLENPRPTSKGPYAQDTRLELGIWIERLKNMPNLSVKVGAHRDFPGLSFIHYYMVEGLNKLTLTFAPDVVSFLEKVTAP